MTRSSTGVSRLVRSSRSWCETCTRRSAWPTSSWTSRDAHLAGELAERLAHLGEVAHQGVDRGVEDARHEALEAALVGLLLVDLGRDADVAGVELAAAADRAADGDHRRRAEAEPVGAHADQLDAVHRAAQAAVGPDLDPVADARLGERVVREDRADLAGQAGAPQRVLARGAGAAVVAGDRDDVGARLGDADGDRADARDHRDLDDDLAVRVRGLELVDELRQVLDRVEVVVVRRADEVAADLRVAGPGDRLGHLRARQVAALAGLGALADLDLHPLRGVDQQRRDAEAPAGDLLAAVLRVAAVHVVDLAALAVHAEHVGLRRPPRRRSGRRSRPGCRSSSS